MAQISVNTYLHKIEAALDDCNGELAGRLFSFRDPHVANPRLQLQQSEADCEKVLEPPWDELVAAHLRCCYAAANHDFLQAFECQSLSVSAFAKILQAQKEENWSLPIMFVLCVDLRNFASSAENRHIHHGKGKSGEFLERAAEQLMQLFRICASDTRAAPEDSKKWGMLNLVNQLFKIYFKIKKLQLCKPLIRAIDSLPIKDRFSLAQLITYRYYVGKRALFEGEHETAVEYLSFAFQRCLHNAKKNKHLVLIYLIPVKMLLGQMPRLEVLRKYNLTAFTGVVEAVKSGNLYQLTQSLQENEAFFIRYGIYLILEKLKVITYRTLFKKVALILKTHQLPITAFTVALRMMGEEDVDDDYVEGILANLIYENKIKGYISHQHRKLVVSKQNAFPPLSSEKFSGQP